MVVLVDVSDGDGGGLLVFNCENNCNNCPIVTGWSGMIMVSFDSILFSFSGEVCFSGK